MQLVENQCCSSTMDGVLIKKKPFTLKIYIKMEKQENPKNAINTQIMILMIRLCRFVEYV